MKRLWTAIWGPPVLVTQQISTNLTLTSNFYGVLFIFKEPIRIQGVFQNGYNDTKLTMFFQLCPIFQFRSSAIYEPLKNMLNMTFFFLFFFEDKSFYGHRNGKEYLLSPHRWWQQGTLIIDWGEETDYCTQTNKIHSSLGKKTKQKN